MKFLTRALFIPSAIFLLMTALPFLIHAAENSQGTTGVTPPAQNMSFKIVNPLNFTSIDAFFIALLKIAITLLVPFVVLFIILAGFNYVTARGNPAKIKQATEALTWAIIGGVIIIGAVAIAGIIRNFIVAFGA